MIDKYHDKKCTEISCDKMRQAETSPMTFYGKITLSE